MARGHGPMAHRQCQYVFIFKGLGLSYTTYRKRRNITNALLDASMHLALRGGGKKLYRLCLELYGGCGSKHAARPPTNPSTANMPTCPNT